MVDVHRLPGPVADTWDWQRKGLCRDMDSSLFFHPERERGEARTKRENRAKAICQQCPVIVQCRQHALATRELYGIWGAMTEHERRLALEHRKSRTVKAHAVA